MEQGQFIKILEGENLSRKETVQQLKEIIQQYPYFQTAHILLAKALHEQNNIDFERALKLTAVYAGDRSVLFDYINRKQASQSFSGGHIEPPSLAGIEREEQRQEFFETKASEPFVSVSTIVQKEESYNEYFSEEEIPGIEEEEEKEEKIYDPHDLIRRRLSEILKAPQSSPDGIEPVQPTEEVQKEMPLVVEPAASREEIKKEEIVTPAAIQSEKAETPSEEIISREAEKANDPLARMEVEYAMESSILESLEKLPPIIIKESAKEKPVVAKETQEEVSEQKIASNIPKTFTEWLKAISPKPFSNYSQVHSGADATLIKEDSSIDSEQEFEANLASEDELIDKFIAAEPKIVPLKTEFYSPVNQAKKSLMEHDDVVSETLAKIYREQGNLARARWCYQRLSLLYPEKSAFFAALLKEIDDLNKEDL
jgi:hypothetical protein